MKELNWEEILARRAQVLEEEFARQGRVLTEEERQRFGLPAQRKQREQK